MRDARVRWTGPTWLARGVWLGGLLTAACERQADSLADASTETTPCDAQACVPYACMPGGGGCEAECRLDEQCAEGFHCNGSRCFGTECTAETAPTACGPYGCVDGRCAADCAAAPCSAGYYCRGSDHRCVPRCQTASDAVCEGFVCALDVGECEPYCLDGELACAAGYACAAGACVPDTQGPPCSAGCGAYRCVSALDRCATRCNDSFDCAPPATCIGGSCQ